MFLKKLAIINYKSCRDLILNFSDNLPNTFIGRTDSGKTTILKALGFLLGEKIPPNLTTEGQISSDISTTIIDIKEYDDIFKKLDLPVFPKEDAFSIIIIGIFNKQEGDFEGSFNDIASNHLKWSIDSNPKDEFPILIQFNKSNKSGRYFICALDKKDEKLELWNQNQNTLKEHRKKFNVSEEDINNVNQAGRFKNIEVFKAIYNKIDTSIQWSEYDGFGKKDRSVFPSFKYMDWQNLSFF